MSQFEELYLSCRQLEGRIMTDSEVKTLPRVSKSHPHYSEWKIRAQSAQKLMKYLQAKKVSSILDVGCGNGWLANKLSDVGSVVGVDIQGEELRQGQRLFPQVEFIQGDVMSNDFLNGRKFEIITLASVIQYFPSVPILIGRLMSYLSSRGEIHIIDSPIYANEMEARQAKVRSDRYYESYQSNMSDHYFHHCEQDFNSFTVRKLVDPNKLLHRYFRRLGFFESRFPWLCLSRE